MAYSPISLAEIYSQTNHLRAQDQYSRLTGMQIQQGQRAQQQQDTIDSALQNPNATYGDFAKGGLQGVQTYGAVQGVQQQLTKQHYKTIVDGTADVMASADPIATAMKASPEFVKDYEAKNGPGSFAQLGQEGVRDLARQLHDHSLRALISPEDQYKQEGPGGEYDRAAIVKPTSTQQEYEQAVKEGFKGSLYNYKVSLAKAGASSVNVNTKPQLIDVPQPDGTVQKQWVIPGQAGGVGVGAPTNPAASKVPTEGDKKNAVLFSSMLNAEKTIADLNAKGGADTSSIANAALGSSETLKMFQSSDYKKYEAAGLRWAANLLYLKSGATANPDEIRSTWKQFFPQPNEDTSVKEQKNAARLQEIEAVRSSMVPSAAPYSPTQATPARPGASSSVAPDRAALEAEMRRRGLLK